MTRNLYPKFAAICLFILLFTSSVLFAHGELEARIKEKTTQISKDKKNAHLYYERGYLYQQHKEYKKALKDFEKSETLGNTDKLLYYRRAETYLIINKTEEALLAVKGYFKIDAVDIKIYKLKAQILIQAQKHEEALVSYNYVLKNTIDLRPQDFIEYATIVLSIDSENFKEAIATMDLGIEKTGENTLTLQLKKLEYLEDAGETEKALAQYNYFILENNRKEFWYYKKAFFLNEVDRKPEANIALQQSKLAVQMLSERLQNTPAIKKLITQINQLEKNLEL